MSATLKQEHELNTGAPTASSLSTAGIKKKKQTSSDKKYISIQCTGYLKSWPLTKVGLDHPLDLEAGEDSALSCLVAVGRPQPSCGLTKEDCLQRGQETSPGLEFSSRHAADGRFSFVDPRVTLILGHLSQELLGTSIYEHIHNDDIPLFAHYHKRVLKIKEEVKTPIYRLKSKDGRFITVETRLKKFMNPQTKELEFIICKHNLLVREEKFRAGSPRAWDQGGHRADGHLYRSDYQIEYKGQSSQLWLVVIDL